MNTVKVTISGIDVSDNGALDRIYAKAWRDPNHPDLRKGEDGNRSS